MGDKNRAVSSSLYNCPVNLSASARKPSIFPTNVWYHQAILEFLRAAPTPDAHAPPFTAREQGVVPFSRLYQHTRGLLDPPWRVA